MSRTSPRRHAARLAAGLSVAAAAALLAAAPAQAATPVKVFKSSITGQPLPGSKQMHIAGSDVGESIRVTVFNGAVTVSNSLGSVQAGPGCVQLGSAVKCDNVIFITYSGGAGDDSFRNDTSILTSANGGPGSDRYTGGPGEDRFRGGTGVDFVDGGGGSDFCEAENESACERDFPPPPKVRVP